MKGVWFPIADKYRKRLRRKKTVAITDSNWDYD